MPEESLGNFGAVRAEGVGSTATKALWTFGVTPTHFHPSTRILKAAYRERRQSFVAIKRKDEKRCAAGRMENGAYIPSEKACGIVQSFPPVCRRMQSTIASIERIIGTSYRRSEKIQRTRVQFLFFAPARRRNKIQE